MLNIHCCRFRNEIENLIIMILSVVFSLLFMFSSPLHPWRNGAAATDSSVFKTVALMMERGYLPYKDSFDHKGPFMYLVNFVGNKISYYNGVWILEVFSLAIAVFAIYKISRLSCSVLASVVSAVVSTGLLFDYFEGGNMTEEYAMPCIAIAIYVFLDFLINDRLSNSRTFLCGVCLGIVLMLRPNMIAPWIVFCVYILIKCIQSRKYAKLVKIVSCFTIGTCVVVVPIFIWLAVNGDLNWFWKDYIVFNGTYIANTEGSLFKARLSSLKIFAGSSMFVMSFICILYSVLCNKTENKKMEIKLVYVIYMIVASGLVALSGREYAHYGLVLIPLFAYPISLLFEDIEKTNEKKKRFACSIAVSVYLAGLIALPNWLFMVGKYIPTIYSEREEREIDNDVVLTNVIKNVEKYTDIDDAISVYGNWDIVYVLTKRIHATQYSFMPPIGSAGAQIENDYFQQLQTEQPKVIVVQRGRYNDNITNFLDRNGYKNVWRENDSDLQSAGVYASEVQ